MSTLYEMAKELQEKLAAEEVQEDARDVAEDFADMDAFCYGMAA